MNFEKKRLILPLIPSLFYFFYSATAYSNQEELLNLSVEDLLNVKVISVAKKAKSLNDSPAAIFVISQDDIKRIGATSIPEALRLAPGIDVARIDSNKWAVTARGFNGRFANKLLVLIDGRSIYTRAFAGVYWENNDVMLEDVEHIEVIRGPGATLWGANAVNGVINIITKHSADTQGRLLVAGGGTEEQGFGAFRYGGELNEDTTARIYVKGFKRDEYTHEAGGEAGDDWDKVQGGFRLDSQLTTKDHLTIQGDAYRSQLGQNTLFSHVKPPHQTIYNETIDTFGGNLLARLQHIFSSTSDYSLQIFYDFYQRDELFFFENRHVIDIDFQHRFSMLNWNDVVWGVGYRYNHDDVHSNSIFSTFNINPPSKNDQLFSAFIQDEITLIENHLWLTLGSKFEHNDYSGFEIQPTARIIWAPHHQHRLWGGVSRAVRTPSRGEQDASFIGSVIPAQPPIIPAIALILKESNQFDSENVVSYEIGYRTTMIDNVSIDITAFYNHYNNLRLTNIGTFSSHATHVEQTLQFTNNQSANTYGLEVATVWQMLDWWRWDVNYSLLKMDFDLYGFTDQNYFSPQQHASFRSSISASNAIDIDLLFRYVDVNAAPNIVGEAIINDYVSMDIRLAWRPIHNLEISLVGQNLLSEQHLEYQQEAFTSATETDRGMYGKLVWKF